ncbi:MAG: hypothetical protein ACK5P5_12905 [Pseudobdellovibrionaceae bacterium]
MSQFSSKVALVVTIALSVATAFAQTQPTTAPAAGSTTATIPTQAPSVLSRFSASAIFEGSMDEKVARASGLGAGRLETLNAITGTFKIDDRQKVSLRQYFEWNRDEVETGKANQTQKKANAFRKANTSDNNINMSWLTARYHRTFSGILGSEKTETLFWWYLPTGQDPVQRGSNGSILRIDYAPTWTITPKWSFTYYVNPRLTLVDRDNYGIGYNGQQVHLGTTFRMVQGPILNYAINDKHGVSVAPYIDQAFDYNDGMRLARKKKFKTTSPVDIVPEAGLARNRYDLNVSYEFTQKLSDRSTLVINPYVSKLVNMDDQLVVQDTRWAQNDDLTYNLLVSISL